MKRSKTLMVKKSTSINKMNNYLSPEIIKLKKRHDIAHGLEQAHRCSGIDWLISQLA